MSTFFTSNINDNLHTEDSLLNYGVIVDCGSSGSRAHIFTWPKNVSQSDLPSLIELLRDKSTGRALSKHITPGLSSLHSEPEKASDYMDPIMQFLSDTVPTNRHLDTPIYFMATAGLRLLDDATQKRILNDITRDFRVKYGFPKIKSQVISGEYEGIYAWLSLNLRKIYQSNGDSTGMKSDKKFNGSGNSEGMIEMGGASVQVVFELKPEIENSILANLRNNDAIKAFRNEQITIKVSKNQYIKLFATTFLGLGVNSARDYAIDLLLRDYLDGIGELGKRKSKEDLEKFDEPLKDPCLTEGSSESVIRPIGMATNANHSLHSLTESEEQTFKIKLEGSGNFLNCINLLERVMQLVKTSRLNCSPNSNLHSCPMSLLGEKFIPFDRYPFVGLSELFFTTNEMMNLSGSFNKSKIMHSSNQICSTHYDKLVETYSRQDTATHPDRILHECFKASWLLTLLHNNGFSLPSDYQNFKTIERLDGREIDWTLGALVSEIVLNDRGS